MKSTLTLPEEYQVLFHIDLQKDKKLALGVNILCLAIAAVMAVIGLAIVPISALLDFSQGAGVYFLRFAILLIGLLAYIVLHELIHGVCMKYYSHTSPHYGFTGLYAYAGSDAYFAKKPYLIIALAPVVFWGVVLLILNLLVSPAWFWVVYIIQITNISGAAGDLYVTWRFSKLPADILVRDTGVSMTVYGR